VLSNVAIRYSSLIRHYGTSRKVEGSKPDWVNELFSIDLILPVALGPVVYSDSNKNEYQNKKKIFLEDRALSAPRVHNLTATCERIV
jgi:hypothetical protein